MDPMSMLIAACVVGVLVMRIPEALAELEYARRGEQSPEAQARVKRLTDAGIDPAVGGAARQYVANLWRDGWLDLDERRRARRAVREPYDPAAVSWWRRLRAGLDDAVRRGVDRWRTDPGRTVDPDDGFGADAFEWDSPDPDTVGPDSGPQPPPPPAAAPPEPDVTVDAPQPEPTREPIKAELVRDTPLPGPAAPTSQAVEGEPMTSSLVRSGTVTGVLSGAAEARAIQRALENANAEYVAAMARVRARIVSLGEQTANIVQMSLKSHVIQLTVQAAEAAAQAQAAAKACGQEVTPILGQVARAFERLNS